MASCGCAGGWTPPTEGRVRLHEGKRRPMGTTGLGLHNTLRPDTVLSPQMQLTIQLLGLTHNELDARLREAAEGNPLLRVDDVRERPREASARRRIRGLERGGGRLARVDDNGWESALTRGDTLSEHLLRQVGTSDLAGAEVRFAALVIGNLDERGWLDLARDGAPALTLEDLAHEAGLDPEDAAEVLAVVQRFDPAGVAARDLAECLLAQADEHGLGDLERTVIRDHLPRVERGHHDAIARALGVEVDAVREAVAEIRALDPAPARAFGSAPAAGVAREPEVAIREVDGEYVVVDLFVNPYGICEETLRRYVAAPETRRFLTRCKSEAKLLLTAVERRNHMVLRVTEEVLRRQREFFKHGPRALRPLTMAQVADALDVHESTVSRAVTGKSVDTPRGVYDLRFFFRAAVATEGGGEVSNEAAREALRALIASEDPRRPWSDAALARELEAREGVRVARRTVTKYREALRIPSSSQRQR